MAAYYKYADTLGGEVNWASIGKNITDMLEKETQRREEEKAKYEKEYTTDVNTLLNAPQGKYQDGNKFINEYSAAAQETMLNNYRLLKSGRMKPKDWTLRTQNLMDGTKRLFDLQNTYQKVYEERMQGVQSGDLQALNTWMMSSVEGFANFSKSRAIINPIDNTVNLGMMEKDQDGIMKLTGDVMPTSVAMGKLLTPIKSFRVDDALKNAKAKLGSNIDYLYNAATTSRAGTITKLVGTKAMGEYAQFKPAIDEFNNGVQKLVDSYFAVPYNLTSVLTQNTGNYSSESFTYDKELAKKDPSKILMMIDPSTGIPTIDPSGAHYNEQKTEAGDWVKSQFMLMLDRERSVQTTSQLTDQYNQEWRQAKRGEDEDKQIAAGAWNQIYFGNEQQKKDAAEILLGTNQAKALGLMKIDLETEPGTVWLRYDKPQYDRPIQMRGVAFPDFSAKGVEIHGVGDRQKAIAAGGGSKNTQYVDLTNWKGLSAQRSGTATETDRSEEVRKMVSSNPSMVDNQSVYKTAPLYDAKYKALGFSFSDNQKEDGEGYMRMKAPNGTIDKVKIWDQDPKAVNDAIAEFMALNQKNDITSQSIGRMSSKPKAGGAAKYN